MAYTAPTLDDRSGDRLAALPRRDVAATRLRLPTLLGALALLAGAVMVGVSVGPAALPVRGIARELLDRLPLVSVDSGLTDLQQTILWEVRMPRVVLGAIVGALLASCGAAYQGVFRNPLADPYLLGVAAGAGLGATIVIVYGPPSGGGGRPLLPVAAFAGGAMAVGIAYVLGATVKRERSAAAVVLAGVAVAAFLTAAQTYLQQRHAETLREVYSWILGRLTLATWSDVRLLLPYAAVSATILLLHRRLLDVLQVGEEEADALGVNASRVRLAVVIAATLGTAAAVAVTGLIGFVGIIVAHTVRMVTKGSYRVVLPLSMIGGAAFLVLADVIARSVQSPAELPIGVVTAFFGAPFFLLVLSRSGTRS
jgi:iron complex transport system permease protein